LIFRGTFEYALDAKHRLTVQVKYRPALAAGVVLAVSPETEAGSTRSLSIWPAEAYEAYVQSALANVNPLLPQAREIRRALFNNSWDLELDSANRLSIPATAMAFAGLDREVVITGSGDCLEVWDRKAHAEYNEGVLARLPEIVASFDHTD
jgi:MraZ protein